MYVKIMNVIYLAIFIFVFSTSVFAEIEISLNYDHELKTTFAKKYDIRGSINLRCTIKATENEKFSMKWERDEGEAIESVEDIKERLSQKHDGNLYSVRIEKATEDDAGTYYCVALMDGEEVKRANITIFSKYKVKTSPDLNFVEGEMIRIQCLVHGTPKPKISWQVGNTTYEASTDRVLIERDEEKNVDNAIFKILQAEMTDRGIYTCIGEVADIDLKITSESMVRIKDKYAALWPFLGICAEVFILCAIILIYEKKRNKAELEESDTDQSPDQKNTPDHEKDSNLRHRQ